MAKKQHDQEKLIQKTMALSAQQGWANLSLCDIAEAADLDLSDLHDLVQDKTDILVLFGRMIDRRVLDNLATPDEHASARERLFDILMDRFESLNEYRDGLRSVLHSFKGDPKQAVISLPYLCRSMTWMLEAAGIETNGLRGALKVTGLTGLYLKTLKTWVDDDSSDLAKTMATLDSNLSRAEQWANSLGF